MKPSNCHKQLAKDLRLGALASFMRINRVGSGGEPAGSSLIKPISWHIDFVSGSFP